MNNKSLGSKKGSTLVNIAALIIIFAGMIYAKTIITQIILALFISIICAQPISWLEKKKVPRWLALLIVILGLIILLSGFTFLVGGTLSSFSGNLSKYETTLTTISKSFIQFLNEKGFNIPGDQAINLIQPARVLEYTATALNALFSVMENTFLVFLIILFILMEFGSFSVKAKAIQDETDKSLSYFSTILQNIRHYLAIKTLICLAVGILTYIALLIIGIDYPLLWALIAGLMNYIPNIGSIISTIPIVLFALVQSGISGALWTLGSFVIIHNIIGSYIEPRIMGKGLGLSALVVFLSLLFWGFILGIVGMILSVPITMAIKIVLEQDENTRWLAVLLGTPAEADIYLQNKQEQNKKPRLKDKG